MKTFKSKLLTALVILMVIMATASCAGMKHDCRGHLKYRQSNGVWF